MTQLFFQSGPVVTISGGPVGGAPLSPTPRGSVHLPGSFAVRPPEGLWGFCDRWPKGKARNRWPRLGAPGPLDKGGPTLVFSVSPSFSGLCRGLLCASHFCPSVHGRRWGQCVSEGRSIYGNKMSFFLDRLLFSRGPSEVEGDRRGSRSGRSRGGPTDLSASVFGDQAIVPLPTTAELCTGRGPARGPVASAESPERAQGCGRPRAIPAGSEWLLRACQEPQLPQTLRGRPLDSHNFLLLCSAIKTQWRCSTTLQVHASASPFPQRLLPGSRVPIAACFRRGPGTLQWASCHSQLQLTSPWHC